MSFWKKNGDSSGKPAAETESSTVTTPTQPVASKTATPAATTTAASLAAGAQSSSSPAISASSSSRTEDILLERFGRTRSALGEGTVIQGKLSFDTPVRIDGKLSGEIFSSKVLIVGPSGQIDAKIEVAALVVLGSVKGDINASERVELWSGAAVDGKIKTPVVVIQDGSFFSGSCEMLTAVKAATAKPAQGKSSAGVENSSKTAGATSSANV